MIKISFVDFWDGFDPNRNFFTGLFSSVCDIVVVEPSECDILIFSCFGSRNQMYMNKKRIFYTGENLRPSYNGTYKDGRGFVVGKCDYSFSFDVNEDKRNIRIPLWLIQIDWFNEVDYGNPKFVMPYDGFINNEFMKKNKVDFCSFVFNSNAPYRYEIIEKLSKYKKVDCFGKPHEKTIPYGEMNKLNVISNYKFNICFENSLSCGYCTEKLIHAKYAGCIPVYWGDKYVNYEFNKKSFINLIEFDSVSSLCDKIIELDSNDKLYEEVKKEQTFATKDYAINLIESIKEKIKSSIL